MKATGYFASVDKSSKTGIEKELPFVSIILPTLNEAANVCRQVDALSVLSHVEVIFSDGGSTDGTFQILQTCADNHRNIQLFQSPKGRAKQMNAAAAGAKGEWLIFLHADTSLPKASFFEFLNIVASHPEINAGAFTFRVAHPGWVYRYLEFYVGLRSKLLKLPYGDQAIFVRRALFETIGGYRNDFPLMEDFEIVQRLKKHGGFRILPTPVVTSARRYEEDGFFKRAYSNLCLQLLYMRGVHPKKLAERYWEKQREELEAGKALAKD